MALFSFKRLGLFDNLELFSSENENDYFPFHFHESFCVSLLTKGTELFTTPDQEFYTPPGTIGITQANEVHRNSSLDESGYSYKTIYVNPEVLTYFNNNRPVARLERVINDQQLFHTFYQLINNADSKLYEWENALKRLTRYAIPFQGEKPSNFELLDEIITDHADKLIEADWLAGQFCMSKYHFIRRFKKQKGVTPQTYIMLKRLGSVKEMLLAGQTISDAAYANGFYDSSHLYTAFRRYFGYKPTAYIK